MKRSAWTSLSVLLLALIPACAVMAVIGGSVLTTVEILLPVGLLALALAGLADSVACGCPRCTTASSWASPSLSGSSSPRSRSGPR